MPHSGATLKYMDWDGSLGGVRYRAPRVLKSPCSIDTVSWKSQANWKCLTGRVDSTTSCSPQLPASRLLLHREQLNPTQRWYSFFRKIASFLLHHQWWCSGWCGDEICEKGDQLLSAAPRPWSPRPQWTWCKPTGGQTNYPHEAHRNFGGLFSVLLYVFAQATFVTS